MSFAIGELLENERIYEKTQDNKHQQKKKRLNLKYIDKG